MQVEASKQKRKFDPVDLTITFETSDELNEFYGLFNMPLICDAIQHLNSEVIRRILEREAHISETQHRLRMQEYIEQEVLKEYGKKIEGF